MSSVSDSPIRSAGSAVEWLRAHALWVVLLLALLVRLPTLISRPLWYDEAFAVLFSAEGPRAMSYGTLLVEQGIAADVHPLGYYTLLWIWQAVAGAGPVAVRSLSVILGLVVVYMGYRLSRRLFDERTAIMAALMLAFSPFQVHYSQEVRMYALLSVLLLGATLVFWRALEGGSLRYWLAFAVLGTAAQYTHTLAALYLIPLGLTPLWRRQWSNIGKTVLAGLLAMLLYLPWLIYVPSQMSRVRWAYWIPQPGPAELVRTWLVFTAGLPVPQTLLAVVLFGTVLATALGAWGTLRGWRSQDPSFRNGIWLLYLAVFPVLFMFLLSYWQAVYLERALLTSGAVFLLWLAWALSTPRLSDLFAWTGRLALLGTFALGLFGYFSYAGFPYAPWPRLNEDLRAKLQDQEVVLHSNKITALPSRYYAERFRSGAVTEEVADGTRNPELEHRYLPDPPGSGSDTLAPATQEVLGFLAEPNLEKAVSGANGVWFIIFAREELEYLAEGYQAHPSLEKLSEQFTLESVSQYGELEAYHFVK
ncbi:MAG: glycosyltransferase family 39 protein [Anaerolineae bacterium]|nr:MAG: glycosyltransferase family 39 protein [Anaerolineae bacterium]